jgi:uncharacterized repeat protein (TIGR03803 family)
MESKIDHKTVHQNLRGVRAMLRKIFAIGMGTLMLITILTMVHAPPVFASDQLKVIHTFTGGSNDGRNPAASDASLTLYNGELYGMTMYGGSADGGTIFSLDTIGTNFSVLHSFTGSSLSNPRGSLIVNSGKVYGMTYGAGSHNSGSIFSMDTTGSNYSVLHDFAMFSGGGMAPYGGLTLDSGKLYGMAYAGGSSNVGTIFSINTNGSSFNVMRNFTASISNGAYPKSDLTLHSGMLYGMTTAGGSSSKGTIFSIDPSNNNFSIMHSFTGGASDGEAPIAHLLPVSGKLYGMTPSGGSSSRGTIFSIDLNTNAFSVIHSFTGSSDGGTPDGGLIYDSGRLFGVTVGGGSSNAGTLFSVNPDGSEYVVIHNFSGGASDGGGAVGTLLLDNGMLYGMTNWGGGSSKGTVYSFDLDNYYIDQSALSLGFGYTDEQIDELTALYRAKDVNASLKIGLKTWKYLSDSMLPGEPLDAKIGDFWTYNGYSYIKLGSGLSGSPDAPEPATIITIFSGLAMAAYRRAIRRK